MHKIQRIFTIYIHNIYILYIDAYSCWAHIIVCVLSSLSFLCVCVHLGHCLCVSLSPVPQHKKQQTNIIIIYKTRRQINYIYIYYVYMCVYIPLYICRIYRPCAQLNARPSARPTERPPARLNWPIRPFRPPARLARSKNQTTKQNQQCVMCAV